MRIPTFKTAEKLVKFNIETNAEIKEKVLKLVSKELKILEVYEASNFIDSKRLFKTHALNLIALYSVCISTTVFDADFDMFAEMHLAYNFCIENGISKKFVSSENFRRVKKLLGL